MDPKEDRYPALSAVVTAAQADPDFPDGDVTRFEVYCLSSGEATWRAWEAGVEEPVGKVIPPA